MNYRNHSMDELVDVLTNETDRSRFIEASKAFLQKFVDGNFLDNDERVVIDEAAMDERLNEMQDRCQNEAVSILEDSMDGICQGITGGEWKALINSMKMLG